MNVVNIYGFGLLVLAFLVVTNLVLTLGLAKKIDKPSELTEPNSLLGQKAPHFEGDIDTGKKLDSNDLKGHPYLLIFISPTCHSCRDFVQDLMKILNKTPNKNRDVIFILDGSIEEAVNIRIEDNISHFPILIAPRNENPIHNDYKIELNPSFVLVTSEGSIIDLGLPDLKKGELKAFLK
jgi:hypothetical protein